MNEYISLLKNMNLIHEKTETNNKDSQEWILADWRRKTNDEKFTPSENTVLENGLVVWWCASYEKNRDESSFAISHQKNREFEMCNICNVTANRFGPYTHRVTLPYFNWKIYYRLFISSLFSTSLHTYVCYVLQLFSTKYETSVYTDTQKSLNKEGAVVLREKKTTITVY